MVRDTIDPRQLEFFLSKPSIVEDIGLRRAQEFASHAQQERGKTKWVSEGNVYLPKTRDYIPQSEWVKLTPAERTEVRRTGVEAFNQFRKENIRLATGEWYPRAEFKKLSGSEQGYVYEEGLSAKVSPELKVLDCVADGITAYDDIIRITKLTRAQIDSAVENLKRGGYLS